MPDKFDPYREALVMEAVTIWPEEFDNFEMEKKDKIAIALHNDPAGCENLQYVRTYTGFCRQITITSDDVTRVG